MLNVAYNDAVIETIGGILSNGAAPKVNGAKTDKKDFDKFLTAVEKRTKDDTAKKNEDSNVQPVVERTKSSKSEPDKPVLVKETSTTNKAPADLQEKIDSAEKEIIQAIADICGVPQDVVIQWFALLNIQPLDLTEPQTAAVFLQTVLDVQEPVLLLKMPEFQDMLHNINTVVQEYKPLAEAVPMVKLTQTSTEILTGLQAVPDESDNLVVFNKVPEDNESDFLVAERPVIPDRSPVTSAAPPAQSTDAVTRPENTSAEKTDNAMAKTQDIPETIHLPTSQLNFSQGIDLVPVETTSRPQSVVSVDATDVMNQIISRVKLQTGDGFAEVKMTLRPETLGDVSLKVATLNGIVTAQFVAENQRVREVIEAHFSQLKDVLQQQGVQISELTVSVRQDNGNEQINQFNRARQSSRQRIQRITSTVAEVQDPAGQPVDLRDIYNNTVDYTV